MILLLRNLQPLRCLSTKGKGTPRRVLDADPGKLRATESDLLRDVGDVVPRMWNVLHWREEKRKLLLFRHVQSLWSLYALGDPGGKRVRNVSPRESCAAQARIVRAVRGVPAET